MRILVVTLNVALAISMLWLFVDKGFPSTHEDDFFIAVLALVTPPLTLYSLWRDKSEGWLSLWLKRKATEERHRLKELESKDK